MILDIVAKQVGQLCAATVEPPFVQYLRCDPSYATRNQGGCAYMYFELVFFEEIRRSGQSLLCLPGSVTEPEVSEPIP